MKCLTNLNNERAYECLIVIIKELEKAKSEEARKNYKGSFSNPKDFLLNSVLDSEDEIKATNKYAIIICACLEVVLKQGRIKDANAKVCYYDYYSMYKSTYDCSLLQWVLRNSKDYELISLLLNAGADPNTKMATGKQWDDMNLGDKNIPIKIVIEMGTHTKRIGDYNNRKEVKVFDIEMLKVLQVLFEYGAEINGDTIEWVYNLYKNENDQNRLKIEELIDVMLKQKIYLPKIALAHLYVCLDRKEELSEKLLSKLDNQYYIRLLVDCVEFDKINCYKKLMKYYSHFVKDDNEQRATYPPTKAYPPYEQLAHARGKIFNLLIQEHTPLTRIGVKCVKDPVKLKIYLEAGFNPSIIPPCETQSYVNLPIKYLLNEYENSYISKDVCIESLKLLIDYGLVIKFEYRNKYWSDLDGREIICQCLQLLDSQYIEKILSKNYLDPFHPSYEEALRARGWNPNDSLRYKKIMLPIDKLVTDEKTLLVIYKYMPEELAKKDEVTFKYAIENNWKDVVRLAIKKGAPIEGNVPNYTTSNGKTPIGKQYSITPLMLARKHNFHEIEKMLIAAGAEE